VREHTRHCARNARMDTPPSNVELRVWYEPENSVMFATFDGHIWRWRNGKALEQQPVYWYPQGVQTR
jgi:hypothetical protein